MKTICECCGKRKAGGGQRMCYGCIGRILSAPDTGTAALYPLPLPATQPKRRKPRRP